MLVTGIKVIDSMIPVGFGQTPSVAASYLLLTGFLVGIARFAHPERDVSTVADVPDSLTDVAAAEAQ